MKSYISFLISGVGVEGESQQKKKKTRLFPPLSLFINCLPPKKKGRHFGAYEFFTGSKRQYSARSKGFTTLLVVRRSDFMALLQIFTQDYEKFMFVRDKILLEKDFSLIFEGCSSCKRADHFINECPVLHQEVNRHRLALVQNRVVQERAEPEKFSRSREREKFNCLVYFEDQKQVLEDFQLQNEVELRYYLDQVLSSPDMWRIQKMQQNLELYDEDDETLTLRDAYSHSKSGQSLTTIRSGEMSTYTRNKSSVTLASLSRGGSQVMSSGGVLVTRELVQRSNSTNRENLAKIKEDLNDDFHDHQHLDHSLELKKKRALSNATGKGHGNGSDEAYSPLRSDSIRSQNNRASLSQYHPHRASGSNASNIQVPRLKSSSADNSSDQGHSHSINSSSELDDRYFRDTQDQLLTQQQQAAKSRSSNLRPSLTQRNNMRRKSNLNFHVPEAFARRKDSDQETSIMNQAASNGHRKDATATERPSVSSISEKSHSNRYQSGSTINKKGAMKRQRSVVPLENQKSRIDSQLKMITEQINLIQQQKTVASAIREVQAQIDIFFDSEHQFELMKVYSQYYPWNNYNIVIGTYRWDSGQCARLREQLEKYPEKHKREAPDSKKHYRQSIHQSRQALESSEIYRYSQHLIQQFELQFQRRKEAFQRSDNDLDQMGISKFQLKKEISKKKQSNFILRSNINNKASNIQIPIAGESHSNILDLRSNQNILEMRSNRNISIGKLLESNRYELDDIPNDDHFVNGIGLQTIQFMQNRFSPFLNDHVSHENIKIDLN